VYQMSCWGGGFDAESRREGDSVGLECLGSDAGVLK